MMTTPQLAFLINRLTRFGIPDWQVAPTIPALTEGDVVTWSGQRVTGYPDPTVTATVFVNGVSQGSTYTTQTGDAGKSIYVHLSATNMYGTDTIDSAAVVVAGGVSRLSLNGVNFMSNGTSWLPYGVSDGHFELTRIGDEAAEAAMGATMIRSVVRLYGTYGTNYQQDMQQEGQPGSMKPAYLSALVARLTAARAAGLRNFIAMDSNKGQGAESSGGNDFFSGSTEGNRQRGLFIGTAVYLAQNYGDLIDAFEPLVEPNSSVVASKEILWAYQEEFMAAVLAVAPTMLFAIGPRDYAAGNIANCINPAWLVNGNTYYGKVFMTCNFLDALAMDSVQRVTRASSVASTRNSQSVPAWINQLATHFSNDPTDVNLDATMALHDAASGGSIGYSIWERVSVNGTSDGLKYLSNTGDPNSALLAHTARIAMVQSHFSGVPYMMTAPVITGTPTQGYLVTYLAGTASGRPTPTLTARVLVNGVDRGDAASYTLQAGDVGLPVVIRQAATNTAGTTHADSAGVTCVAGTTWKDVGLMAANANPSLDYNTTAPCRNLAKGAMRKFNSAVYNDVTDVTLNTSGANKGYPVDGTAVFGTVFLSSMVPAQAGVYKLRCKGNNPFLQAGSGVLSASTYDAVNNWTTATLTITNPGAGDIVALQWNNVVNFGDLWVMQPGYNPGDTTLLTTEAQAHYSIFNYVRVMDRVVTNENFQTDWVGSNLENEWGAGYANSLRGAVDFAQAIGATLWVNVPTLFTYAAKVSLMQALAAMVPSGFVIVEFGNEPWNFGFGQYWKIMENVFDDAQIACGVNSGSMRTDRRILSCNRSGTTVTITLNFDPRTVVPGFGVGSQVYDHSDFSQGIAEGMRTLTAFSFSAGTATLQYTHPVSGNTTGFIKTDWFDSFLYLNPSNNLTAVPVSLSLPDWARYTDPQGLKTRWEMKHGLRELYDAAGVAGIQNRVIIRKGVQFEGGITYERLGLAYCQDNYGSMSWLTGNGGGLTPACYMRPLDGNVAGMVDATAVFTELEARRADNAPIASAWNNFLRSWNQFTVAAYEGGPHNDKKPNQTVADAVQAAHKDDRMRVLIKNQIQDWTDRGGDAFCYFSAGSTRTFNGVIPPFSNNNTWSTTEGNLADAPTAPKYKALAELAVATFARAQVAGVNSGTIRFGDVNQLWGDFSAPGNGQVAIGSTVVAPRVGVLYNAAADGNYSIALKCGSTAAGSDSATLYVDGVAQGASAPMTSWGNSATVPTGTCLTRTVALTKGPHFISVDIGAAPRAGNVSVANVIVTAL